MKRRGRPNRSDQYDKQHPQIETEPLNRYVEVMAGTGSYPVRVILGYAMPLGLFNFVRLAVRLVTAVRMQALGTLFIAIIAFLEVVNITSVFSGDEHIQPCGPAAYGREMGIGFLPYEGKYWSRSGNYFAQESDTSNTGKINIFRRGSGPVRWVAHQAGWSWGFIHVTSLDFLQIAGDRNEDENDRPNSLKGFAWAQDLPADPYVAAMFHFVTETDRNKTLVRIQSIRTESEDRRGTVIANGWGHCARLGDQNERVWIDDEPYAISWKRRP